MVRWREVISLNIKTLKGGYQGVISRQNRRFLVFSRQNRRYFCVFPSKSAFFGVFPSKLEFFSVFVVFYEMEVSVGKLKGFLCQKMVAE